MSRILKILLSLTTLAACLYGVNVFGLSMWPLLFSGLGLFMLVSLFFPWLDTAAVVMARIMGLLSFAAFALLMLAATVGGSFHLSASNQTVAVFLALMAMLGCAFFVVKIKKAGP